jgi:hypothetical protein
MSGDFWRAQTLSQLENCFRHLRETFPACGWRIEFKPWKEQRSLSQNALSWKWYKEIADQIHAKTGMGPFTDQDIHDRLVVERFGHETVKIGSIEVTRPFRTRDFDTGVMHHYMRWIEWWCAERDIKLTIPAHSEYQAYKEAQVA